MKRSRREFLAGTGWADNKNPAVGRCDAFDPLPELPNRGGMTDQRRRYRCQLLELLDLTFESGIFQRAIRDQDQPVRLEGFNEVVRAQLDCGDPVSMLP
jgi:hypothetical protein